MQLADNLTWQAGKWDPDISSFHKMRKGRKGNARKEFEIFGDQRVWKNKNFANRRIENFSIKSVTAELSSMFNLRMR